MSSNKRKAVWMALSPVPVLSFAAIIFGAHDFPVWKLLLSAGIPVAIVDGIRSHWWFMFVVLVAAHYGLFTVHPLVNRALLSWKAKFAWLGSNLMLYPLGPPIYVWFCIGGPETSASRSPNRRR
jgi:cell division protein FtsW (lipid II flippase)